MIILLIGRGSGLEAIRGADRVGLLFGLVSSLPLVAWTANFLQGRTFDTVRIVILASDALFLCGLLVLWFARLSTLQHFWKYAYYPSRNPCSHLCANKPGFYYS